MGGSNPINNDLNPPPDSLIDNGYRDVCYSGDSWLPEAPQSQPRPAGEMGPPYPNSYGDLIADPQAQCGVEQLFTPEQMPAGLMRSTTNPLEVIPYIDINGYNRIYAGQALVIPQSGSVEFRTPIGQRWEISEHRGFYSATQLSADGRVLDRPLLNFCGESSHRPVRLENGSVIFDPQMADIGPGYIRVTLGNGEFHYFEAGAEIPVAADGTPTIVQTFNDTSYRFSRFRGEIIWTDASQTLTRGVPPGSPFETTSTGIKFSPPQPASPASSPPATPPAPPAAPPAPPSSPPVDPAQPVSGATPVIVLDGSRASWLLTFEEGQVRRVRVGTDFIDVKLENGCFQAQRVGYEHRGFEPLESFGFSRFEARTGAIQTPGGVRQTIQFVRAGLPQFDLGQNIRPSGMPFRIAGSDLVFKISRTSGPMEISMEGPTTHQILFLERESTSLSLGNGLVVRKVGASVVIESTVPPAAAIPAAPAAAQPVPAAPAQPAAAAPQLPTATVCLTSADQTVTIEGRSYIVRPGVNGNGSDVVLVMSASDGARVSVNPNSQNYFMSGGKKIVVTWDAATGEVTITQVPSSQSGRGPNDNPPAAPAGGGAAGATPAGASNPGLAYSWGLADSSDTQAVEEDQPSVYGVSWGMPFEPVPASATAGYVGDVCWTPGLEPVAVGVGASGGSEGVRLFDGYAYYTGADSMVTEMVSRPGSPTPPPAESAGVGSRAMTMARGFGAGLGVMTALSEGLDLAGVNNVPVVRHVAGTGVFLAGHAASVSATTEMTFVEAATNPASLGEFWSTGGRFMFLMPLVSSQLASVGFTRDALPEGVVGGALYQAGNVGVTMLADATMTSTATTLGTYLEGVGLRGASVAASTALEVVSVYGWVLLGLQVLSDMQSLIMPDAIGMEEDIRVAQMFSGVATCSTNGNESMLACTEDDWWEARHTIQGAMPQYVDQLTAAEEQVHGQMNAEALADANNLRTVFSAMLAERLSMEAMAYDGSTEPLTTSDRLAAMLRDIISSGLPSMPTEPVYPTIDCNTLDDDCDSNFDDQTDYALMPAYEAAVASYPGDIAEYNRVTSNYNTLKNILTEEENRGKNLAEIKDLFVGALVSERHISESEALPQFEETLNVFMGEQFKILAEAKTPFGGEAIFPVIGTALVESGPVDESEKIADYLMYQPIGETSIGAMSEVMDAAADIAREAYMMNYENGMVELVGDTWVVMPSYIPTADDRNDWRVIELTADDPLYAQGYSYMINPDYMAYKILDNSGVLNTSQG